MVEIKDEELKSDIGIVIVIGIHILFVICGYFLLQSDLNQFLILVLLSGFIEIATVVKRIVKRFFKIKEENIPELPGLPDTSTIPKNE